MTGQLFDDAALTIEIEHAPRGPLPDEIYPFARIETLMMNRGAETVDEIAESLGISTRQIHRIAEQGGHVAAESADHMAITAGLWPGAVWPDEWESETARVLARGEQQDPTDVQESAVD